MTDKQTGRDIFLRVHVAASDEECDEVARELLHQDDGRITDVQIMADETGQTIRCCDDHDTYDPECGRGDAQKLCIVIYDYESGTVLDAESCSILIVTNEQEQRLSDGMLDPEQFTPAFGRPVITDAVRFRLDALQAMEGK